MDIEETKSKIAQQLTRLEGWLNENASSIHDDQNHLDAGSEAQRYWHYGRAVALRDVLNQLETQH